jgi:hypothetical protein
VHFAQFSKGGSLTSSIGASKSGKSGSSMLQFYHSAKIIIPIISNLNSVLIPYSVNLWDKSMDMKSPLTSLQTNTKEDRR